MCRYFTNVYNACDIRLYIRFFPTILTVLRYYVKVIYLLEFRCHCSIVYAVFIGQHIHEHRCIVCVVYLLMFLLYELRR